MINERLDLLREALPYIQRFKNKTFVVKLSGKVTEDQEQLYSLAEEITLLALVARRDQLLQPQLLEAVGEVVEEVAHAGVVAVAVNDLALEVSFVVAQLALDVAQLRVELVLLRCLGGA